jgi:hypothetical protein
MLYILLGGAMKRIADLPGKIDHVVEVTTQMGPLGSRAFSGRAAWSGALWLVLFFAARFALEMQGLPTWVRAAIALAPVPVFAWFLWEFIRGIGEADELERRIQLEALAVAFPLTILLLMTLGLLQIAVPLPPDDWSYRHIWPLVYVFYLLGLTWARRRYL